MLKVKWIEIASALDENRYLKPHGYVNDGRGGNISLCGKISITEDENDRVRFEDLSDGEMDGSCCKFCIRKYNKVLELGGRELSNSFLRTRNGITTVVFDKKHFWW